MKTSQGSSFLETLINSAAFGWSFAVVVLGSVGMYAWHVAYVLHTTGSELIKYFVN